MGCFHGGIPYFLNFPTESFTGGMKRRSLFGEAMGTSPGCLTPFVKHAMIRMSVLLPEKREADGPHGHQSTRGAHSSKTKTLMCAALRSDAQAIWRGCSAAWSGRGTPEGST